MIETQPSTCRLCSAYCPVVVTLDDGKVIKVEGNHDAPLYGGFTCPKGRALPSLHNNPNRLLHTLKRQADGTYKPIPTDVAESSVEIDGEFLLTVRTSLWHELVAPLLFPSPEYTACQ